jgi:hypothetical protein
MALPSSPRSLPVPAAPPRPALSGVRAQLLAECDAMMRYAFAGGLQVPAAAVESAARIEASLQGGPLPGADLPLPVLAQLHGQLSRLVAPATPRTIRLLDADRSQDRLIAMLGPLPNVRRLMVAAGLCTASFVFTSLSPLVDSRAMSADIYTLDGVPLLATLCFLLSAAGMGSTFHALFTAQRFVAEGTYDPRHDASYWIRLGLGFVAGLLMAVLIPVDAGDHGATMGKPLLALLGGFSAGLVYNVLRRLVDTVESLFQGDRKDVQKRQEELQRTTAQHAAVQARMDVAEQLVGLRDELARGTAPEQLNERLTAMLDGLLNRTGAPGVAAGTPPAGAPEPPRNG